MSFYEPFYHPYQIPHPPLYPVTLPLRERLQELEKQRSYCRLVQLQAAARQNEQAVAREDYVKSILINDKVESDLYRKYYNHELDHQMVKLAESQIQYNYLKKVEDLRRERELLENPCRINAYSTLAHNEPKTHHKDERFMSDDELVRQYGSGYRGKQFRQELIDKMNSTGTGGKAFDNSEGKIQNLKRNRGQQNRSQNKNQTAMQRSINEQQKAKRSYIDDLNKSHNADKIGQTMKKKSRRELKKGQTIDVFNRTFNNSQFKDTYLARPRNKKSMRSMNKTINHSMRDRSKKSQKFKFAMDKPANRVVQSAMKKINNRLRVSEIVYKDSKLKHNKHEADHLLNTFENEAKMRKQIKNKINNHPDILKKHNLVAESR